METQHRITSGRSNPRESATENYRQSFFGKVEKARQELTAASVMMRARQALLDARPSKEISEVSLTKRFHFVPEVGRMNKSITACQDEWLSLLSLRLQSNRCHKTRLIGRLNLIAGENATTNIKAYGCS